MAAQYIRDKKQKFLWEEYHRYIQNTPMNSHEKNLLYEWVRAGNSVYENPGSRYLVDTAFPPKDFLDVYREDCELDQILSEKTPEEKERYLKQYMGYDDEVPSRLDNLEAMKAHIRETEHDLFYLWEYICSEGLWSEAKEYLDEHREDPIPFGWE